MSSYTNEDVVIENGWICSSREWKLEQPHPTFLIPSLSWDSFINQAVVWEPILEQVRELHKVIILKSAKDGSGTTCAAGFQLNLVAR